jgi:CDP-glucose 4,6-dehydratase
MENMVDSDGFWQGRHVFVTGAAGLVGSWLIQNLLRVRARVVALIHHPDPQSNLYRSRFYRDISIVQGNLEDYGTLEYAINKYEIDTVFHLAAQPIVGVAHRSPLQTFEANIRGTYNLLEACRQHSNLVKRIVVASSDKAYGTHDVLPYTEDMALQGKYPYEVSKSCADLICQTYYHAYDLPVTIARCGNIYGGGDLNWSRIIPDAIRCCLSGRQLEIRSDGTFVRDYIYVKDVTTAYMRLAESLEDPRVKGRAFNFSPWQPLSVLELVEQIQQLWDCPALEPRILNNAKGEIHSQYLDSSKAREILGWQPRYTLSQGLQETITWYKDYFSNNEELIP